jgi:hypothetical protein
VNGEANCHAGDSSGPGSMFVIPVNTGIQLLLTKNKKLFSHHGYHGFLQINQKLFFKLFSKFIDLQYSQVYSIRYSNTLKFLGHLWKKIFLR